MNSNLIYIGVDVAKDKLDIYVPTWCSKTITNSSRSIKAFLRQLSKHLGSERTGLVCVEPTGGYERTILQCCWELEVGVCRIDAWQARRYAQSFGILEKTDKLDAQIIARFAEQRKIPALAKPSAQQIKLREIWRTRQAVSKQSFALQNLLALTVDEDAAKILRKTLNMFEKRIAELEDLCEKIVKSDKRMKRLYKCFLEVKGVGKVTIINTLAEIPEIGTLTRRRISKLAGLAPIADDSGTRSGQRHIRKGRSAARNGMYMAALSASSYNDILSAFYKKLIAGGKPRKVALTAVMRKLLICLNSIAAESDREAMLIEDEIAC